MPWQNLLRRRDRLPANPDLGEGFATLLHQLGNVTPFELAVAGGRFWWAIKRRCACFGRARR